MRRTLLSLLGLLALFALGSAAQADEAADFDAAVTDAYRSYRTGLFYARTGNTDLAGLEFAAAQDAWTAITEKFSTRPPAAYAADGRWREDLGAVAARLAEGVKLLEDGKGKEAHDAALPVADILSALRTRNGRANYSDCVLGLTKRMDALFRWRHRPPDFAKPGQADKAMADALAYRGHLRRCRAMAPEGYVQDADFKRLYDGADASISSMPAAIDRKDALGVVNILRELRSFDRIIFFKLG